MSDFYNSIELTPEELQSAILEGKKKKYFHEKNKGHWASLEKGTTKQVVYQSDGPVLPESVVPIHPEGC